MRRQPVQVQPTWTMSSATRRCEVCGRPLAPDAPDLMTQLNAMFMASLSESLGRLLPGLTSTQPRRRTRDRCPDCECDCDGDGGCDRCAPDPCHCRCCIGDADLVIYARVGERRVVPVVITNSRRREREINLELSQWTTRSGKPTQVTAVIQPPTKFTLKACEEQQVVILVNAAGGRAGTEPPPADRLPDVDECEVLYADLRVEGCDIRPIRIALALLPRDCAAYEVECWCGCC